MSERTEGDEMCLLCGEPRAEHLKSPADWRTVPGCTGLFRKPSGTTGPADAPKHCSACGRTDIWDYCDERTCPVRRVAGPADAPKQPEVLLRYCQPEADLHVFGLRCLCGDVTRVEPPRQPHDKWPWDNQPSTECAGPVDCPECASTGSGMVAGPADAGSHETGICMFCDGCGWCEGSPAFTCPRCKGTGKAV